MSSSVDQRSSSSSATATTNTNNTNTNNLHLDSNSNSSTTSSSSSTVAEPHNPVESAAATTTTIPNNNNNNNNQMDITSAPSPSSSSTNSASSSNGGNSHTTKPVKQTIAKKHLSNALSTSAKRIQKELAEITLDPPPNCSAGPKGDNLYEWFSTIYGPAGSVYESGMYFNY